jgi:hypothetical protein
MKLLRLIRHVFVMMFLIATLLSPVAGNVIAANDATVNQAPIAVDDFYTTTQETTLTGAAPGVLANDSEPDGDPLRAGLISQPFPGTAIVELDGSFVFTPAPGSSAVSTSRTWPRTESSKALPPSPST